MKIVLCSVGKAHDSSVKEGIDDFTRRINNYFTADWLLIPPVKNGASLSPDELKKEEGKAVFSSLQPDDCLILLDERGKPFSSPQLARLVQQKANESTRRIVFLIGGAYGVDPIVFKRAEITLSLSQMVFPHMLVRFMIAEQVYRACTILRNEKYHHI